MQRAAWAVTRSTFVLVFVAACSQAPAREPAREPARRDAPAIPAAPAAPAAPARTELRDATDARLAVGQRWRYRTRPGDEASRVVILKIESSPQAGTIVHVAVDGIRVPCKPEPMRSGHAPFARDAVLASITELEAEKVELPSFSEGYRMWRDAFDRGEGGVFTISLAESAEGLARGVCPS
jgi:hypothetical protein